MASAKHRGQPLKRSSGQLTGLFVSRFEGSGSWSHSRVPPSWLGCMIFFWLAVAHCCRARAPSGWRKPHCDSFRCDTRRTKPGIRKLPPGRWPSLRSSQSEGHLRQAARSHVHVLTHLASCLTVPHVFTSRALSDARLRFKRTSPFQDLTEVARRHQGMCNSLQRGHSALDFVCSSHRSNVSCAPPHQKTEYVR